LVQIPARESQWGPGVPLRSFTVHGRLFREKDGGLAGGLGALHPRLGLRFLQGKAGGGEGLGPLHPRAQAQMPAREGRWGPGARLCTFPVQGRLGRERGASAEGAGALAHSCAQLMIMAPSVAERGAPGGGVVVKEGERRWVVVKRGNEGGKG